MYILDVTQLLPGDIVLTALDAKVSKAIRRLTGSAFSHAMLYVDEGCIIHSNQQGVQAQNTQRVLLDKSDTAMVLRLSRRPDQTTIRKICDYARAAVGTQYSIPEAIASWSKRRSNSGARANRQFCSRLVAEAYSYSGHSLVPNPSYCYPSDLHNIDLVIVVPNCLRKANEFEIEFAKSPSPLEVQVRVINAHLARLRSIASEDIQNEEQTVAYNDGQSLIRSSRPVSSIAAILNSGKWRLMQTPGAIWTLNTWRSSCRQRIVRARFSPPKTASRDFVACFLSINN